MHLRLAVAVLALGVVATDARADDRRVVVDGRVVGPDGKPVRARVLGTLEWDNAGSTFWLDYPEQGDDGSFALRLAPSGSTLRRILVRAYALGYSTSTDVWTVPKGEQGYRPLTLRLRPTIDVTVKVVDPNGAAIPGATVTIAPDSFSTEHPDRGVARTVDARGEVVYAGVNDDDDLDFLIAGPGDYLPTKLLHAELAGPLTAALARGADLKGRLIDRATRRPIAGCRLDTYGSVTTDRRGRFTVPLAPYGGLTIWPACAGYGVDYDHAPSGLQVAHPAADAAVVKTITARKNHVITGRVVVAGRGVAGATVAVHPEVPGMQFLRVGPPVHHATTDASGRFRFASFSADRFTIDAVALDGRRTATIAVGPRGRRTGLRLVVGAP